jgi:hypothetical protein
LVEDIMIIGVIFIQNHPYEASFHIIDVGLLQLSRLKVCVYVRVKRYPTQFFPIIRLIYLYLELDFGSYLGLVRKNSYLSSKEHVPYL